MSEESGEAQVDPIFRPIHALRWIGRKHVDDEILVKLRRNLKPADRAALVKDASHAPGWIADIFHRLAKDAPP